MKKGIRIQGIGKSVKNSVNLLESPIFTSNDILGTIGNIFPQNMHPNQRLQRISRVLSAMVYKGTLNINDRSSSPGRAYTYQKTTKRTPIDRKAHFPKYLTEAQVGRKIIALVLDLDKQLSGYLDCKSDLKQMVEENRVLKERVAVLTEEKLKSEGKLDVKRLKL